MRYLSKSNNSQVLANDWRYPKDREAIRDALLIEQRGFCAYSERYVQNTDAVDVEHFDPRLKRKQDDSYWNWYTVLSWMNRHKPRNIDPFEPILEPYAEDLRQRISFQDGQFFPVDPNDKEAKNLIAYLGWQSPELTKDRKNHVKRIRDVQRAFGDNQDAFFKHLIRNPANLSFFSALSVELGLPDTLIEQITRD